MGAKKLQQPSSQFLTTPNALKQKKRPYCQDKNLTVLRDMAINRLTIRTAENDSQLFFRE